ncbi:glutaredoxin-like protein NrdH [Apilactobacillus xinyiensis]|jgi:glutaredoxin-like protein NrdH|uniref:Glutaredoxin-like protein NrdH n=1 Tax=Apilactobacillus xinyiensis TaxID=2841032 RepID=A0ABT0I2V3_9LACO|nr:glutaredoxin-like protein NrdH [Apilactobacillus xinyiensis]MCK8625027.1 glutaredoxin-like protein NrdH [Apilactobacillus xinyiensis]MCL0312686.1 glutaredoxin-like protein NrdH [Apilactobacillus xinyiensis]MCL0319077.1 glutaredoxin-like protein NrdH [Apilactobacillus xinyiensis]MCL0330312.1 glutaredoxin-like protein NrdH [Apilactobacillus xinyiensis]
MEKVTVYSKNNCIQCKMTKKFLEEHNVEFIEKNINEEPEYIEYLKEKGFMSLPVVETNEFEISGFRPDKLSQLA